MLSDVRLAVLADAHGNAFALEAVLNEVYAASPDLIINLGDQVWGRTDPGHAYALQCELSAVEVCGNNEEKLTFSPEQLGENGLRFRDWLLSQLPSEAVPHLVGLPLTAEVADGSVFLTHGTPQDANQELLWAWHLDAWIVRSPGVLRQHLAGIDADMVVVGHTHREGVMALDDRLLVNVGSVGWQIDGDPRARWTLLERRSGRWRVEFRRVAYDTEAAAHWVLAHDPDTQVDEEAYQEAEAYKTGRDPGEAAASHTAR